MTTLQKQIENMSVRIQAIENKNTGPGIVTKLEFQNGCCKGNNCLPSLSTWRISIPRMASRILCQRAYSRRNAEQQS